jgi:hypothetical protein
VDSGVGIKNIQKKSREWKVFKIYKKGNTQMGMKKSAVFPWCIHVI